MPTSKPLFYEFTTRKIIWAPSRSFVKKMFRAKKGDEISQFDGTKYVSVT
jgi:hypothetical protein